MKATLAALLLLIPLATAPAEEQPTISLYVKVQLLHPTGIIGQALDFRDWNPNDVPLPKRDQLILITGHPKQNDLADGDEISITVTPDGTTKYSGATIRSYRYLSDYK